MEHPAFTNPYLSQMREAGAGKMSPLEWVDALDRPPAQPMSALDQARQLAQIGKDKGKNLSFF